MLFLFDCIIFRALRAPGGGKLPLRVRKEGAKRPSLLPVELVMIHPQGLFITHPGA